MSELSRLIQEAYSDQLKVYSDEKIKEGICKGFNDRQLIANMLAFVLYERKLDKDWKKLYQERKIDLKEGGEALQTLNSEFRLADMDGMKYIWKSPTIPEFFIQARRIGLNHLNYGLLVRFGRNALEKYSYEEINEKYRASFLKL